MYIRFLFKTTEIVTEAPQYAGGFDVVRKFYCIFEYLMRIIMELHMEMDVWLLKCNLTIIILIPVFDSRLWT